MSSEVDFPTSSHPNDSKQRDRVSKRNYARRNRDKHLQWLREDSRGNPLKYILQKAKARAKRDGVAFDLTEADFNHVPLYCPIFPHIKLIYGYGRGHKRQNDASATLDRIDNARCYVRDNVLIVSWRGNRLKNNATPGDLRRLAEFYGRGLTANTIIWGHNNVLSRQTVSDQERPVPQLLPA